MDRRSILLQQMGITNWQLRRPETLKGAVNIAVAPNIRLIIIAQQLLQPTDIFIQDVLRSLQIAPNDCLFIEFCQLKHLQIQQDMRYWLLAENPAEIHRTLPQCTHAVSLWQTQDLAQLKQSPSQKRDFWRTIQTTFSPEQ